MALLNAFRYERSTFTLEELQAARVEYNILDIKMTLLDAADAMKYAETRWKDIRDTQAAEALQRA